MKTRQRSTGVALGRDGEPVRRGWPLRRYLLGLIALFVAAAAASIGSGYRQEERDALAAAHGDAQYGARHAATHIGEELKLVRDTVAQLAASRGVGDVFAEPKGCELSFGVDGDASAGHLDLLRGDGSMVCSSRPMSGADGLAYTTAAWLAPALTTNQLVSPVVDQRTGRPAIVVTTPVPGSGVVAAFVDLPALAAATGGAFGGARGLEFLITTGDGRELLARWPEGGRRTGPPGVFVAPTASGAGPDVTGIRRVYGHAIVDGTGWRVYAGAAHAPALVAARRLAQRQALVAGIGLLAGLLATYLVYRRITRPIGQLREAVRAAAISGELDTTVVVGGPREVIELGAEFAHLLTAVDHQLAERRRAEETARAHERNYRQMFDTNPYPVYLFDCATLAIVEVNDAAVTYYGYPRSRLLEMTITDLCPPEDATALAEASTTAGPVERGRTQRQAKQDGTVVEVTITSHLVSFAGRPVRCAAIEDITEREHLDQRLRQSQRLESLGQLAGGIAHDFNNLLGIILGYAAMSATEVKAAAATDPAWLALHDDLQQIVAAGDRATALTRQLLSFARADAVAEPRVLDLNGVVAEMDQLLGRTLGEDVRLLTQLSEEPWRVRADPGQLEQVLINLAVNARDAMPSGGLLTIDTEPVTIDAHYAAQHPGLRIGRYMRLRVSDTGAGMSRATVDRAFEPFFTTKPKGQGTGLGLATIYGIVSQAGGQALIYSEPGQGTTVTVLLPATDEAVEPVRAPSQTTHRGNGQTILLVEDDDGLRALTERVLTRHGYAVLVAATAAEAQRLAATHSRLDLLLTDVVMPEMDGHTLATSLRAGHPMMNVIYTSGYTETILAARSTLPAGITLLNKPVSAHHLLTAVARGLSAAHPEAASR